MLFRGSIEAFKYCARQIFVLFVKYFAGHAMIYVDVIIIIQKCLESRISKITIYPALFLYIFRLILMNLLKTYFKIWKGLLLHISRNISIEIQTPI